MMKHRITVFGSFDMEQTELLEAVNINSQGNLWFVPTCFSLCIVKEYLFLTYLSYFEGQMIVVAHPFDSSSVCLLRADADLSLKRRAMSRLMLKPSLWQLQAEEEQQSREYPLWVRRSEPNITKCCVIWCRRRDSHSGLQGLERELKSLGNGVTLTCCWNQIWTKRSGMKPKHPRLFV